MSCKQTQAINNRKYVLCIKIYSIKLFEFDCIKKIVTTFFTCVFSVKVIKTFAVKLMALNDLFCVFGVLGEDFNEGGS